MDLKPILDRALSPPAQRDRAAADFLAGNRARPRYAIGKNPETLAVHRLAPLDGIIDDACRPGSAWGGIPLLRTGEAGKDAAVVNCASSIRPVDALDHLRASGFRDVLGIPDLVHAADGDLPWPAFVQDQRRELHDHGEAWQRLCDGLADEASRRTLRDVLLFRLTADPAHMRGYEVRIADQYFEDFMGYRDETFVDAGGFDGDTAEAFALRHPDYRKILLFEPSARNMARARARLAGFRDVAYFPIGLSDAPGRLAFDPDAGSASSVSGSGAAEIEVDTLDAAVADPVTFIKMDLEGWELPALRGATRHIAQDRPKLAIAAYHEATDLRRIHDFIGGFDHGYRIFLRHYTQGWSETVLFFVGNA